VQIHVFPTADEMASAAAAHAERILVEVIAARGQARVIGATGNSQLAFQRRLTASRRVDWSKVELFHLDEYVGIAADHPASFRRVLREHFVEPAGIARFHALDGDGDLETVRRTVGDALRSAPIDVAFVGIGENAHLAFNDPPADFDTAQPYLVVALDEACRRQQVGEGWFPAFADVPTHALSMSVRQILAAREILVMVPDERKAAAVAAVLGGPITPDVPASILRTHERTTLYLDAASASHADPQALRSTSSARPD
jgi:glucosamine-6-phosphate deaminase